MASTIATINQAKVDKNVVEALRSILPGLNSFSFRAASEGDIKDNSIYVPIATDPTAQVKTAGTIVTGNGTLAGKQVQLSNMYGAGWDVKEGEMSPELMPAYWADKAAGAVYALAVQVINAALGLLTSANFGNTDADKLVVAAADFGQSDVGQLWGKAEAKIKQRQRSLMLNSGHAAALIGESNLALIFANAGENFMSSGILPQLIGMNTFAYAGMPANAENLCGAVMGKGALLVAAAPVSPLAAAGEGNIVDRRVITDPVSNLSVLYTMTADGGGTLKGECALLYGVAVGQDAVVRVVSA